MCKSIGEETTMIATSTASTLIIMAFIAGVIFAVISKGE